MCRMHPECIRCGTLIYSLTCKPDFLRVAGESLVKQVNLWIKLTAFAAVEEGSKKVILEGKSEGENPLDGRHFFLPSGSRVQ